jgi:hypothetical protein
MKGWAYVMGVVLRGSVLGLLLCLAILILLAFQTDARLFRYQGF